MLAVLIAFIKTQLAKRAVGDMSVTFDPQRVMRGGDVKVTVRMVPAQTLQLNAVKLKLIGNEIVQGGDKQTDMTHELYSHQVKLCDERRIESGEVFEKSTPLTIPEQAAPTFHGKRNHVKWEVEANVDMAGWPDFSDRYEIEIQPS
jgi:hypothetical protein